MVETKSATQMTAKLTLIVDGIRTLRVETSSAKEMPSTNETSSPLTGAGQAGHPIGAAHRLGPNSNIDTPSTKQV